MRIPVDWPVWLIKQKFYKKNFEVADYSEGDTDRVDSKLANCISSEIDPATFGMSGYHKIMLDLDCEHYYVKSSTPGHAHLYINKNLSRTNYTILLATLYHFGIIEKGYFYQMLKRGRNTLRLPWIKKEPIPLPPDEPEPF